MNNIKQTAVVMFSDVVGYTAMMGTDEAAALALLQKNHNIQKKLIAEFDGIFVKEIGDGLLAYFPTAEKAITCCYEIQKRTNDESRLKVRIGLNKAEIIIENDDIFGDGVNIASRIEALADPGGIYFSETVATSLHNPEGMKLISMGKAKLKNVKTPVMIYALEGDHLPAPSRRRFQELANPRKKLAVMPAIVVFLLVLGSVTYGTVNYFNRQAAKEEARKGIAEIQKLVALSWRDYSEAYEKAKELQKIIPDDPTLKALVKESSVKINVITEPEGAEVFIQKYNSPNDGWKSIGRAPIDSVELPIAVLRWKVELPGYQTVLAVDTDFEFRDFTNLTKLGLVSPKHFFRKLDALGSIPTGMTRVLGSKMPYGKLEDFFIDIYEVTNRQYKEFVDAGGYSDEKYWTKPFVHNGKEFSWKEAMELFKDKSRHPGPSTWINGSYPVGEEDFPVSGVSWFEAHAYAKFANKELPTGDHWGLARGEGTFVIKWPQMGGDGLFAPFSNFNHSGPVKVGSLGGLTAYGAFDMAGNVKEWCTNDTQLGKLLRGGGWNSNSYEFNHPSQAPPFDRSEVNGFRCVRYLDGKPQPEPVYRLTEILLPQHQYQSNRPPVGDDAFNIFKTFYDYDKVEIRPKLVRKDDTRPDWIHEEVVYQAAYNDEEIIAHLFLPKNAKPPFHAVIYGPGSASLYQKNSDDITNYYEFPIFLEYIVKSGRAVLFPVCQGTFERRSDEKGFIHLGAATHQYTEFISQVVKDYRKSIDYLQTRDDIDPDKIAFYGMSWGPSIGVILNGVETRLKANVFISSGLRDFGRPEASLSSFVTRIKIPTLMLNGKYDSIFPYDLFIEPMYQLLGTPKADKKLVLFDSDHIPPNEGLVTETLAWLDIYLGKVDKLEVETAL